MKRANRQANRPGRGGKSAGPGRLLGARPQRRAPAGGHPLRRLHPLHRSPARGYQGGAERSARTARPGASTAPEPERVREIPTIVEYSATKRPMNQYPKRIVSPLRPQTCCTTGMEDLGKPRREAGWFYVYKRCRTCGFTVRSIVRRDPAAAAKAPVKAAFN